MNDAGVNVLLTAFCRREIDQSVYQLRGMVAKDGQGGFCTIALFLDAVKCPHLMVPDSDYEAIAQEHEACQRRAQRKYQISYEEWLVMREQNTKYDWLTIATLHSPYAPTQLKEW
jgi:hypothetical protein